MKKIISSEVFIDENTGKVFLKLIGKQKQLIAYLKENTLKVQKDVKNIMIKFQTIGFNYDIIKKGSFENVEVTLSDGRILTTTRERILKEGKIFKNSGFELQIFFPIPSFN